MSDVFSLEKDVHDVECSDFLWEEWEEYKGDIPFWQHTFCGSVAGIMEHVCMYPLDTVKTYFQSYGSWNCKKGKMNEYIFDCCLEEKVRRDKLNSFNEIDNIDNRRLNKNGFVKIDKNYVYAKSICDSCVNKPCSFRDEFVLHGKVCPNMNINVLHRNNSYVPYIQNGNKGSMNHWKINNNNSGTAVKTNSKHLNMMHILTTLKRRRKLKTLQIEYDHNDNKELKAVNRNRKCIGIKSRNPEKSANVLSGGKGDNVLKNRSIGLLSENHQMNRLQRKLFVIKNGNKISKYMIKGTRKLIGKDNNRRSLTCKFFVRNGKSRCWKENVNIRRYVFAKKKSKIMFFDAFSENQRNKWEPYKFEKLDNCSKKFMYIENKYYSTDLFKKNGINSNSGRSNVARHMVHGLKKRPFQNLLHRNKKYMFMELANDRGRCAEWNLSITGKGGTCTNTTKSITRRNSSTPANCVNSIKSRNYVKNPILSTVHNVHDIINVNTNSTGGKGSIGETNVLCATKKQYFSTFPFTQNIRETLAKKFVSYYINGKSERNVGNKYMQNFWKETRNYVMQKFNILQKSEKSQFVYKKDILKNNKHIEYTQWRNLGRSKILNKMPFSEGMWPIVLKKENIRSLCGFSSNIKQIISAPRTVNDVKTFRLFITNLIRGNNKIGDDVGRNRTTNGALMKKNIFNLYKGVNVVILGCIPAHALYFSTFEYSKKYLLNANIGKSNFCNKTPLQDSDSTISSNNTITYSKDRNCDEKRNDFNSSLLSENTLEKSLGTKHEVNYTIIGISGFLATLAHDAILAPMDTIKQRIQLGLNKGGFDTFKMFQENGLRSLYLSFPVTLLMNVPYQIIMMCTNEKMKKIYFEYMCKRHYINENTKNVDCINADTKVSVDINEPVKGELGKRNKSYESNIKEHEVEMDNSNQMKNNNHTENVIMSWILNDLDNTNSSSNICYNNEKKYIETNSNKVFFSEKANVENRKDKGNEEHEGNNRHKENNRHEENKEKVLCYNTITDMSNFEKEKYIDLKKMHLKQNGFVNKNTNHITSYFVCAGIGGGIAAFLTNPLDVIKTRIQTRCLNAKGFQFCKIVSNIYATEGISSFFKGSLARMTICIPASAISWGSYETMKRFFKLQLNN